MSEDIEQLEKDLEDADKGKSSKRLTPAEWSQIKLFWERGTHTLADLSDMFGIRADTIQRRLKHDGVEKGARAHEAAAEAQAAAEEEMAKQAVETMRRIQDTKDSHYKWNEAIGKMVMQELVEARSERKPVGLRDGNLAALNKAAKTLETIRKERYALLGLDKEDGDPEEMDELIVSELTPDQIERMRAEMRGMPVSDIDGLDTLTSEIEDGIVDESGEA